MKCSCGARRVMKLKPRETLEEYMNRSKCTNCGSYENWKIESSDESRFH